ncbi:MAG: hypothetical protein QM786_08985 [Breznakibacter sp.]
MENLRYALDEICKHQTVAGYKFLPDDEVEIRFVDDSYNDLIIPISPKMTIDHMLTVFYYYIKNFRGAC